MQIYRKKMLLFFDNMNKGIIKTILLSILMGGTIFIGTAFSQDKKSEVVETDKSTILLKAVKEEGWDFPEIDTDSPSQNRTIYFQQIPVIEKHYFLENTFDKELDSYYLNAENNLVIKSKTIEVKYVSLYSIGDKSFAFAVVGAWGGAVGGRITYTSGNFT